MNQKKLKSGRRTRRTYNPVFKARVALAALREDKTLAERQRRMNVVHAVELSLRAALVEQLAEGKPLA